jgi:hypothetical protein
MPNTAPIAPSTTRTGVNVHLFGAAAPVVSPEWNTGGWIVSFVRLDPQQRFALDHARGDVFIKVVTGRLENIDRSAYAAAKVVRSTRVSEPEVVAGPDGAIFTVFIRTAAVAGAVTDMNQLTYTGPHADLLGWQTFESRYSAATPFFNGLDAYLSPGFHLLDGAGDEISYVFVWTAGKGVDLSTHNHGRPPSPTAPAFAEVHWVMHNGTGSGGMYETPEPGADRRDRTPMQQGDEHGPFFVFDERSGRPVLRENGAVEYPWHGWEAGADDGAPGQRYDVVAAFEITAPYADVFA